MTDKPIKGEPEQNPFQPPVEPAGDPKAASNEFIVRALFWGGMFLAFFLTFLATFNSPKNSFSARLVVVSIWGFTLFVVFLYALIKRSKGQPLSWAEIWKWLALVGFRTFMVMVVAPFVLALALFIALWCICMFSMPSGMFGH